MTDVERYLRQGEAHLRSREWQAALEVFEVVCRASPDDAGARRGLGRALIGLGRYERAVRELEAATSLRPDDPRTLHALGEACARLGRFQRAVVHFHRASDL